MRRGAQGASRPSWREQHQFPIQAALLVILIVGSFALFGALEAGRDALAMVIFAGIAASFAATMWVS